jgi:serine phosphatase RsbU (regulator of sigma subunit)
MLSKNFIIYQPKDIVSGDFYWFHQVGDLLFIASIDCTGHGVPGALMTVLTNTLLNQLIIHQKNTDPAQILKLLDDQVCETLSINNKMSQDGLDIALCRLNGKSKELTFSGAFQNMFLFQNGEMEKIRGGRFPIGNYPFLDKKIFTNQSFVMNKGDRFYLCSDGYQDQFGGGNDKKMGSKKVALLLQEIQVIRFQKQKKELEYYLTQWKGDGDQVDDILFMGFEV